jgi:hypothetical protein
MTNSLEPDDVLGEPLRSGASITPAQVLDDDVPSSIQPSRRGPPSRLDEHLGLGLDNTDPAHRHRLRPSGERRREGTSQRGQQEAAAVHYLPFLIKRRSGQQDTADNDSQREANERES